MTRIRPALLLALLVVAVITPAVSAQEADSTSETITVDETLTITGWAYDEQNEELQIEFAATRPTTVTITEAASADNGRTGELSITSERVLPGNTTVELSVSPGPAGEAAVVVTTAESVDRERGVFLSTGQDGRPQPSPFADTTATAGWLGGAGLALLAVICAGVYQLRTEATEPEVA